MSGPLTSSNNNSSNCSCAGQCSCGSSVIPTGPKGPQGSPGPAGINGITNIYSYSQYVTSGSFTSTNIALGPTYNMPGNTLSALTLGRADAIEITLSITNNYNPGWIFTGVTNQVILNLFNNNITLVGNVKTPMDFIIKIRVSLVTNTSVNVNIYSVSRQLSNTTVKNTTLTGLSLNLSNPISVLVNQAMSGAFVLKGFYVDKISAI